MGMSVCVRLLDVTTKARYQLSNHPLHIFTFPPAPQPAADNTAFRKFKGG